MTHKILVIDDEAVIREGLRQALTMEGYQVIVAPNGKVGMEKLQKDSFSVVISDLKMPIMGGIEVLKTISVLQPNVPVIIITGFATVDSAVDAMKNGAFEYLTKPFLPDQIIEKVQSAVKKRLLSLESEIITESLPLEPVSDSFIGKSDPMQKVFQRILQVAPTNSSVLITGESGTGKELVARAIQRASNRKNEVFISVDLGAISESLFESELFGFKKGAFTDAKEDR
ncbi:MAG: response regulator, partial [Desulfuromusa sp.]|nr:response regulator [Desulfuromusa sp.]